MAESEIQAVEAEILDEDNVIKLRKPLESGKDSIVLDFDKLNGHALIKCAKLAKKEDAAIAMMEISKIYQAHIAAAAAGMRYDDILSLSAPDFTVVCLRVQNFLLNASR